ncbi:hypothetical protein E1258_27690 [Micromonospora sp. KC207]|uniref:5'-methylthioadenosine/S-adenosylhomocysteine nucleosidase family protein n=1 Tax=Micromonospora sp. KC207 TaxID=2530377 RepID=UPI0010539061|nr:hypothetical protein [Micromonospora sp. KC207]TDC48816.1 hypothetical protein E1258_27690 [Micromonospora sp. KC207]
MPELTGTPTWAQCRAAADAVRAAEHAREAVAVVRPRGPFGLIRSRGPVPLLLYVAAREGRLVWRDPESFAMLQPPGDTALPVAGGLRLALLRRLVRHWDTVLFAGPLGLLMVLAGLATLLLVRTGHPTFGAVALLCVLLALLLMSVLMSCLVGYMLGWIVREFGRPDPPEDQLAAELLPGRNWTMVFCHHDDGQPPERLLRRVQQQLTALLRDEAEAHAERTGVRLPMIEVTEALVCLRHGVTTDAMRAAVATWSGQGRIFGEDGVLSVRMSAYQAPRQPNRIFDRGGFLFLYLFAVATYVGIMALFVADWERAACSGACEQHPVDYPSALRWLSQRLLFTDPFGLGPSTQQAWTIGWLTSLMSLMGVFVVIAAVQRYVRYRNHQIARTLRRLAMLNDQTRTLIMVATSAEREAVLTAVREVNGAEPERMFLPNQVVLRLGAVSRTQILLAQVEPGAVGPGSAAIGAAALISQINPDFLILAGICYGLRPGEHEFGDVLVCTQLRAIDLHKEAEPQGYQPGEPARSGAEAAAKLARSAAPEGPRRIIDRGDHVTPPPMLLGRFRDAQQNWTGAAVHFGPMLSASTLVSARSLRDELASRHPDAIGGEMEGAGVYAAAAHAKVDWIVVKAICDWGFDKTDEFHELAAHNAARLVVTAAELGGLDEAPRRGQL